LFSIFFAENSNIKLIRITIGNNLISRKYSKKDTRGLNIQ